MTTTTTTTPVGAPRILSRDEILAAVREAEHAARRAVSLPGIDGTVLIRPLSHEEFYAVRQRARTLDESGEIVAVDEALLSACAVQACMIYEDGSRVFPDAEADVQLIRSLPAAIVQRLYTAVLAASGFGASADAPDTEPVRPEPVRPENLATAGDGSGATAVPEETTEEATDAT